MDTLPGTSPVEADLFKMANLYPRTTGLPMTVWGGARHGARVKVSMMGGDWMLPEGAAVVGIRPEPRLMEDELGRAEFEAVAGWIALTREALLAFWAGEIEVGQKLVRV